MRIHLIAIGGAAMHNLALALHQNGHLVTGSDDHIFEPSNTRLSNVGLLPETEGWYPEKITQEIDIVILGMHAHKDNSELLKAQELGLNIMSYPKFIYEQSKNKQRIVIGGSHGKTTITSMILHVLKHHKKDFDYLVGAIIEGFDTMVQLSNAPIIIIEGDEYLSSALEPIPKFHQYKPQIAAISGIAWDHINVFPTYQSYVDQFDIFIKSIEENGTLFYCNTDEDLKDLVIQNSQKAINFSPYDTLDYKVDVENQGSLVKYKNEYYPLQIFGKHNLQNTQVALLICEQLGISLIEGLQALKSFTGAAKRLEKIYQDSELVIFKDFAHSPSKLKATLQAVREQYPDKQLIACMELHTYSSLDKNFLAQYKGTINPADKALVYFNPKVLEQKRLTPITNNDVLEGFSSTKELIISNDLETTMNFLKALNYKNTCLLLMTSGNFGGLDLDNIKDILPIQ